MYINYSGDVRVPPPFPPRITSMDQYKTKVCSEQISGKRQASYGTNYISKQVFIILFTNFNIRLSPKIESEILNKK